MTINEIGALCFGAVIGWICYRTLRRKGSAALSDLATVIGAVGGGAITGLFRTDTAFGWYAIGLLFGFFGYVGSALLLTKEPQTRADEWMGD